MCILECTMCEHTRSALLHAELSKQVIMSVGGWVGAGVEAGVGVEIGMTL